MLASKQFWCFTVVVTMLIICVINWPALQLFLDERPSSLETSVFATCRVLNFHIPIWIFALYYLNYGEYYLRKFQAPAIIYTIFSTIATGFYAISLLDTIMAAIVSDYIITAFYLVILASGQLFFSLLVLFWTILHYVDLKIDVSKSDKYTAIIYLCAIWLVIIVCAGFIIRTTIIGCPIKLELLISLLGLVCFGFIFLLPMAAFFIHGASTGRVTLLCAPIYGLLYFPFFTYWTVRSLIQLHNNISAFEDIGTWMLAFTYFASILSLVLGALFYSLFGLAVMVGAFALTCFLLVKICSLILKPCCSYYFSSNNSTNTSLLGDSLLNPQPISLQSVILDEEKFNPTKHSKSFLEEEVCSVCLEKFKEEQLVTYWPKCNHLFHKECLNYWVKKNPNCPICKEQYINKPKNSTNALSL